MKTITTILIILASLALFAQNELSVGGTGAANSNAIFEANSTTKGALLPRMSTTQMNTLGTSLTTTDKGMIVYDSIANGLFTWDGAAWQAINAGGTSGN